VVRIGLGVPHFGSVNLCRLGCRIYVWRFVASNDDYNGADIWWIPRWWFGRRRWLNDDYDDHGSHHKDARVARVERFTPGGNRWPF
jgi:hypothetical protein